MIPVKMAIKHDHENGKYGDCFRACIASILELPYDEVPHFVMEEDWLAKTSKWMHDRGYTFVTIPYDGDVPLRDVLLAQSIQNPGMYYMLGGSSPLVNHTVVCLNDRIVHDPAGRPEGEQIVGPTTDGYYWVEFIGAKETLYGKVDCYICGGAYRDHSYGQCPLRNGDVL